MAESLHQNFNGVPLSHGKTMHMGLSRGQLANRILCVGAEDRAERISQHLDAEPVPFRATSSRGFHTITGYYKGVHVSIVSIGMGLSMMDFFVRESRSIVDGPMVMIRFGTCGGITEKALPGCVMVASEGSGLITRNYNAFETQSEVSVLKSIHDTPSESESSMLDSSTSITSPPSCVLSSDPHNAQYRFWNVVKSDPTLSSSLLEHMRTQMGEEQGIIQGVNISADSFYSSQGRSDPNFPDQNSSIIDCIHSLCPAAQTLEMETYQLFHLARCSVQPIHASACAVIIANRLSSLVVSSEILERLESQGGKAILETFLSCLP